MSMSIIIIAVAVVAFVAGMSAEAWLEACRMTTAYRREGAWRISRAEQLARAQIMLDESRQNRKLAGHNPPSGGSNVKDPDFHYDRASVIREEKPVAPQNAACSRLPDMEQVKP